LHGFDFLIRSVDGILFLHDLIVAVERRLWCVGNLAADWQLLVGDYEFVEEAVALV
jgi:hypothetical protein